MALSPALEIRTDVMTGKPCIRGTRIPAWLIARKRAAGETEEQLLGLYPQITRAQIRACVRHDKA